LLTTSQVEQHALEHTRRTLGTRGSYVLSNFISSLWVYCFLLLYFFSFFVCLCLKVVLGFFFLINSFNCNLILLFFWVNRDDHDFIPIHTRKLFPHHVLRNAWTICVRGETPQLITMDHTILYLTWHTYL
jgi:hypothetical protein